MFYDRINFILQVYASILCLGSVVITSFMSPMCTSIIVMARNCCKFFWWFYCINAKDTVFAWSRFLFCMNYVQFSFVLVILKVWLIVYLELKFVILFLLLLLPLLLEWVTLFYYLQLVVQNFAIIIISKK